MTTLAGNNSEDLPAKQQKALTALLNSSTVPEAAKACGLSEATLHRYLREDVFKSYYRRARSEIVEHAIVQLQRDCGVASRTLRAVCENTEAPASARVAAAKAILEGAVKAVELQDLVSRIDELERKTGQRK